MRPGPPLAVVWLHIALLAAPGTAMAQLAAPDLAFGAFQRGYYVTALKEALARLDANPNDAVAMTLIGVLYRDGTGVRRDLAEAAHWFRLAADRGDREAIFSLGMMQLQGDGIPQDRISALAWLEKAAARDHAGALYNLGIAALQGGSVSDFKRAADLLRRAAGLGDADAQYALGLMYREGQGVAVDAAQGAQWLASAAGLRHVPAMVEFAIALFNGNGIEKDEAAAFKLFLKAANANNLVAQNRVARLLAAGRGTISKDMVQAMKWHLLARAGGIQDEWLDSLLKTLSPVEQSEVELVVRAYAGN